MLRLRKKDITSPPKEKPKISYTYITEERLKVLLKEVLVEVLSEYSLREPQKVEEKTIMPRKDKNIPSFVEIKSPSITKESTKNISNITTKTTIGNGAKEAVKELKELLGEKE